MLDGAEPIEAAEVVHAVHVVNRTAIDSAKIELCNAAVRIYGVRVHTGSSVIVGVAIIGIGALAIAPPVPPPATVSREVRLTAAPALGAIPLAFIRNQFQYCSLICPHAVEGAITVPLAATQIPATLFGAFTATGSPLQALGVAVASVTGPANVAVTPLIDNDVFLVVPKAFHALDVAVVEATNVAAAPFTPGDFLEAVQTGRANILNALNQPVGTPTTLTGATNIAQVVAVEAINVTTAVAFQAGELLLSGAVQIADASAQELARSGNPAAALAAGATQARQVAATASAPVVAAVDAAVTNIRSSLHDPFSAAKPRIKRTDQSSSADSSTSKASSITAVRSATGSAKDSATPRAKKNTIKRGPPR